jgi:CBS domain-containing protein
MMKVHELMALTVCSVEEATTLRQAARLMAEFDVSALAVLRGHHLIGIVTDRDIAVRGAAEGMSADAPVGDVMTRGVHACHAAEHVDEVLLDMELLQVRHMPIEDDDDRFVGMVSVNDLAAAVSDAALGRAVRNIDSRHDVPAAVRIAA